MKLIIRGLFYLSNKAESLSIWGFYKPRKPF